MYEINEIIAMISLRYLTNKAVIRWCSIISDHDDHLPPLVGVLNAPGEVIF